MKKISIRIVLISFIFSCKIRSNRHSGSENQAFKVINQESDFLDQEIDLMWSDQIKETLVTKSLDVESYQIGKNYYPRLIIERSDDSDFQFLRLVHTLKSAQQDKQRRVKK